MENKDKIIKNKKNNFFMQSNYLYDWKLGKFLNGNDIAIYGYLTRLANNSDNIFPSLKTIYECCCVGRSTAQTSLNRLIKLGLIQKKQRFNDSNIYIVFDIDEVFKNEDGIISKYTKGAEKNSTPNSKDKNEIQQKQKTIDKSISHQDFFEKAWKTIIANPKTKGSRLRQGKSAIKATQQKKIMKIDLEILEKCLELYLKQGIEKKYYMLGSTWFNGRYQDFIDEAKNVKVKNTNEEINFEDEIKKQASLLLEG